jgi:hypothetical protein
VFVAPTLLPTCEETLKTVLPALLRRDPGAVTAGTVVQFIVPDVAKCRYFYTWQRDDVVVSQGVSDKVDLTLSVISEDLPRFLDSSLDMEHAVKLRRVKVMGDVELLLPIASALQARGRA